MSNSKLINVLKKRWKFYIIGFLVFYVFSIAVDGTIDLYHLMPIKLFPIVFGIIIGTAFYYGSIKVSRAEGALRSIKYILIGFTLIVISAVIQEYMKKKGIDISIFVGLPKRGM